MRFTPTTSAILGDDDFASDPPNALLPLFEEDHVNDVVVVLTDPVISNGDPSYAVAVTDGELTPSTGSQRDAKDQIRSDAATRHLFQNVNRLLPPGLRRSA